VGEESIQLFDTLDVPLTRTTVNEPVTLVNDPTINADVDINDGTPRVVEEPAQRDNVIPEEPRRSTRAPQPSKMGIQSMEYQQRKEISKGEGHQWATNQKRPLKSICCH